MAAYRVTLNPPYDDLSDTELNYVLPLDLWARQRLGVSIKCLHCEDRGIKLNTRLIPAAYLIKRYQIKPIATIAMLNKLQLFRCKHCGRKQSLAAIDKSMPPFNVDYP